jgi:small-conductance mechanosensitive channel
MHLPEWFVVALTAGVAYVVGLASARLVLVVARRLLGRRAAASALFLTAAQRPLRLLLGALLFRAGVAALRVSVELTSTIDQVTFALIVFTLAWFVIRAFHAGLDWVTRHLPGQSDEAIRQRVVRTHLTLLRPLVTVVIVLVSLGAVLMQFAFVRSIGLSLVASAGIVGIVVGFAAQKPLAGLVAGLQLSITQPIRIGDTVFIEQELGTVERIHLTYVVLRLREQRMLVIPVARFLDTPFENWTLAAPDVIGSVLLSVDFTTPVDAVRAALGRACAEHEAWDRKTCTLVVTDATERTMKLRALVSSSDEVKNWDLRCFVRERLIAFLSTLDGGIHLPHDRLANLPAAVVSPSSSTSSPDR